MSLSSPLSLFPCVSLVFSGRDLGARASSYCRYTVIPSHNLPPLRIPRDSGRDPGARHHHASPVGHLGKKSPLMPAVTSLTCMHTRISVRNPTCVHARPIPPACMLGSPSPPHHHLACSMPPSPLSESPFLIPMTCPSSPAFHSGPQPHSHHCSPLQPLLRLSLITPSSQQS